ncbi:MAG: EAL domain-containing protein [Chroococcales cyanobacterium]
MDEDGIKILLVEDNLAQARLLENLLQQAQPNQFYLVHVKRLHDAFQVLAVEAFDIILLDLTLPDSQGLESLNPLVEKVPSIPVVVLTNTNDEQLAVDAVRQGAQDYLVKRQINPELLIRSLRYAIERKQIAEALRRAKEDLECRVQERTAELAQAVEQLKQEICDRQHIEQALIQEKELAQVTLHSIGDAVITTDAQGRIQSLNPIAEILTGWSSQTAKGHYLPKVLRLFDGVTDQETENPVTKVLKTGAVIERSNSTLLRNRHGIEYTIEHSAAPIYLHNGQMVGTVLVCRDTTHAHNLALQLAWQASHDSLTGLVNRGEFERRLEEAVIDAKLNEAQHTLCYFDLDQFKIVNDTCGHMAGDELLRQLTSLLQNQVRQSDTLARLGGDEFGLLLYSCSLDKGYSVAHDLLNRIQSFRFVWEDKLFTIGVSIGLVAIDSTVESAASVLSAADTAMYAAKEQGRNRVHVYQAHDRELVKRYGDMEWVSHIVKALEENRFCLYAQAIAPIQPHGNGCYHYELLLRMEDEQGKLVPPMAFIPAAERYNLMPQIDRWVISTLFEQLYLSQVERSLSPLSKKGYKKQPEKDSIIYTVNLSGASLNDAQFLEFIQEQFSRYEISPEIICFEITETVAITNLYKAADFMQELKALGCGFALDDFGMGMSSLAYLKNLPVDYLKIDGSFIRNIVQDPINAAMVEAINRIGKIMGLEIIAEFVEDDAILDKIRKLGVDYAQGYGIAKPCLFSLAVSQNPGWSDLIA